MSIAALIPARSGSKRLKNKNSKKLLGKPLITWTIKTALKVKQISKIFVSTDDERIIHICKKYNISIPWKRPKKLLQVVENQKVLVRLVAGAGFEPTTFRL